LGASAKYTAAISTGIVLAAGNNERFKRHYGPDFVKQSLEINGQSLIVRMLDQLESLGCEHLLIVVGEHEESIENLVNTQYSGKSTFEFVPNTKIERGNGYSLHLGLKNLFGSDNPTTTRTNLGQSAQRFCHLVMSDHVYDAGFVAHVHKYLEAENYPSTLFVDPNIDQIFDLDDATKVLHEDGTLQELGKSITQYNALDTGWFILDMQMLEISSALAGHQRQFGVSSVIEAYQKHLRFHCESVRQGRWQDVDNPAMFEAATKLFS
jgi:choline kinase